MGLLSDIYSWGDTKKRELKGLLADPVGMLEKTVGQLQDSAKERGSLMNQAGWGIASPSTATPEQQRIAQQILADQGAQQAMAAATVWHGSPHKFDKFDSSKIGTGEGAQAYGHGLYLADNPAVAKQYADTLGFAGAVDKVGNQYGKYELSSFFEDKLKAKGIPTDAAKSQASMWADKFSKGEKISHSAALDVIESKGLKPVDTGSLYKVDLPDEHIAKMLDWDKPIGQQSPEVLSALRGSGLYSMPPELDRLTLDQAKDAFLANKTKANLDAMHQIMNSSRDLQGSAFYQGLQSKGIETGTRADMGVAAQKASDALRQAGIPGIRYLDGGSRGTGQGTSNFVIFPGNEGLLKILERNGQALK